MLLIEAFLPVTIFSFRPWESLLFIRRKSVVFPFYPKQQIEMYSQGDLSHHTENAIKKYENWITDELGYRNNKVEEETEVLLIGDSFIAGASLEQDSTITSRIDSKLGLNVYNMAPANFSDYLYLLNNNILKAPKIIVYSFVERSYPSPIMIYDKDFYSKTSFDVFIDKISRFYLVDYFLARIKGKHGSGVKGKYNPNLRFLNGSSQTYQYDQLNEIATNIASYKKKCDSLNIKFIVVPIPNKESVYFKEASFSKQPDYLFRLDSILINKGVSSINVLKLYNDYTDSKPFDYLYHLDDTHWNDRGVKILADTLSKYITTIK